MSETIENIITLNASQAISEMEKLSRRTVTLNKNMTNLATTLRTLNSGNSLATTFTSATTGANALNSAVKNTNSSLKNATNSSNRLRLSFSDVVRIVQSQVLFSSLNALRQGFSDSADAAAELQLQASRIAAIEGSLDITGAQDQIRELSTAVGRGLDESGLAFYEALQNDLGSVSETMEILTGDANDLARVTGGTLPQAVNALSSIYKAFEGDLESTENVAGKLFGTINAGRITLGQMENALGTLSPTARELGVSLQDTLDAWATITLSGTEASVAGTQLRNVFNKLIKPTESLEKVYTQLGVRGFPQLIAQSDNFADALSKITGAVGNDEQEVARLFNTIRANLGVLNILTRDTALYNETAERSAESAANLAQAVQDINDTDAVQAQKNAAQLEVLYTEIGESALRLKNFAAEAFLALELGGDQVVQQGGLIVGAITAATVAIRAFGVASSTAVPILAAGLAGIAAGNAILAIRDDFLELNSAIDKTVVAQLEAAEGLVADEGVQAVDDLTAGFQRLDDVLATISQRSGSESGIIQQFANETADLVFAGEDAVERFQDSRLRFLKEIDSQIGDIDSQIIDGTQRLTTLNAELEQLNFDRSLRGLSEYEQQLRVSQRSAEALAVAIDAARDATFSEESQAQAEAAFKAADAAIKQEVSLAKSRRNAIDIERAEQRRVVLLEQRIAAEENIQRSIEERSVRSLREEEDTLKRLTADAQEYADQIQNLQESRRQAINEGAGPEDSLVQSFNTDIDIAQEKLDALQAQIAGTELVQDLGLEDSLGRFIDSFQETQFDIDLDFDRSITKLANQLRESSDFEINLRINELIGAAELGDRLRSEVQLAGLGRGGQPGGVARDRLDLIENEAVELQQRVNRGNELRAASETTSFEAAALLRQALGSVPIDPRPDRGPEQQATVDRLGDIAGELRELNTATVQQLQELQQQLRSEQQTIQSGDSNLNFGNFFTAERNRAGIVAGLQQGQAAVGQELSARSFGTEEAQTRLEELQRLKTEIEQEVLKLDVDSTGVQEAAQGLQPLQASAAGAAASVGALGTASGTTTGALGSLNSTTGSLVGNANAASQAYDQLAQSIRDAAAAAASAPTASGTGVVSAATGGLTYFNSGGGARGQDTIPARLAQGEFVVNAQASRNFYSQLQALNGTRTNQVGDNVSTTNISIGDINVSSNSQVPAQTARDMSNAIKRELRKGNIR